MSLLISEIEKYLRSWRHATFRVPLAAALAALVLPAACQAQGYTITTVAGTGASKYAGDGGKATAASFSSPIGVAVDKNGNIFVADNADCVIREFVAGGTIATVAGKPAQGCGYSGDGAATAVQLWPASLAVDAAGNIYIAESANGRVRKLTVGGNIVTVATLRRRRTGHPGHPRLAYRSGCRCRR
jgi:DNA-binding beta-propeller fold protein YncE